MATKRKHENDAQRLAKGLRTHQENARTEHGGKSPSRARPRGHTRGTLANARRFSPIVRLLQSLGEEKIRFQLVVEQMNWLPDMDLNHDKQIQSLLCYRYTIGQCDAAEKLMG